MAAYIEIISLNRAAKIRVKNTSGAFVDLSFENSQWVNFDDPYNRKRLASHSSIGQYLTINSSTSDSHSGQSQDLTDDTPYVFVKALSKSSRVRVKGWRNNTESYGEWDLGLLLKEDVSDGVWINLGGDDGNDDPNDGLYNRKQLNHHRSIGQYIQALYSSFVGIRALNRTAKVLVDSDGTPTVATSSTGYTFVYINNRESLRRLNHHSSIAQYIVTDFYD